MMAPWTSQAHTHWQAFELPIPPSHPHQETSGLSAACMTETGKFLLHQTLGMWGEEKHLESVLKWNGYPPPSPFICDSSIPLSSQSSIMQVPEKIARGEPTTGDDTMHSYVWRVSNDISIYAVGTTSEWFSILDRHSALCWPCRVKDLSSMMTLHQMHADQASTSRTRRPL